MPRKPNPDKPVPEPVFKTCQVCGTKFKARQGDNRYCSKRCQTKAYKDRAAKIKEMALKMLKDQERDD